MGRSEYVINSKITILYPQPISDFDKSHNTQWGRFYEAHDVAVEWHGQSFNPLNQSSLWTIHSANRQWDWLCTGYHWPNRTACATNSRNADRPQCQVGQCLWKWFLQVLLLLFNLKKIANFFLGIFMHADRYGLACQHSYKSTRKKCKTPVWAQNMNFRSSWFHIWTWRQGSLWLIPLIQDTRKLPKVVTVLVKSFCMLLQLLETTPMEKTI